MAKAAARSVAAVVLCGVAVSGCTSLKMTRRTPDGLVAQVMAEVCLPYVADGASLEQVRRKLDFAWSQDLPELLTSGPPGPVFRQGFLKDDAILSFNPGTTTRVPEARGMRDCRIVIKTSTPADVIGAVTTVLATRPEFTPGEPAQREIAKFCAEPVGASALRVHVIDVGPSGVIAGVSQSGSPREGC